MASRLRAFCASVDPVRSCPLPPGPPSPSARGEGTPPDVPVVRGPAAAALAIKSRPAPAEFQTVRGLKVVPSGPQVPPPVSLSERLGFVEASPSSPALSDFIAGAEDDAVPSTSASSFLTGALRETTQVVRDGVDRVSPILSKGCDEIGQRLEQATIKNTTPTPGSAFLAPAPPSSFNRLVGIMGKPHESLETFRRFKEAASHIGLVLTGQEEAWVAELAHDREAAMMRFREALRSTARDWVLMKGRRDYAPLMPVEAKPAAAAVVQERVVDKAVTTLVDPPCDAYGPLKRPGNDKSEGGDSQESEGSEIDGVQIPGDGGVGEWDETSLAGVGPPKVIRGSVVETTLVAPQVLAPAKVARDAVPVKREQQEFHLASFTDADLACTLASQVIFKYGRKDHDRLGVEVMERCCRLLAREWAQIIHGETPGGPPVPQWASERLLRCADIAARLCFVPTALDCALGVWSQGFR
nr:replication-associated protein [arborvitae Umbra-like virus]